MKPYVRAGIIARLAVTPFLLQWFHPDERQMLEFAHFHAHGRLHPFLEATDVHLRNQTLPALFSWIIRALDSVGAAHPWAYLITTHTLIGLVSWGAMVAMVENFRTGPEGERTADRLGWFLALFWAFPFLYSRSLLEAVSLPATLFLWVALQQGKYRKAGFFAGLTSILRYPSALWSVGAFALASINTVRARARYLPRLTQALVGFVIAILIGGIADAMTYGRFLESATHYWDFNRPGGPVAQMFGGDSLFVYWRWFAYLFTPWLAPFVIVSAVWGLIRSPTILIFCLPYLIGHVWTPHREPRFMLPLIPLLALAVAHAWTTVDGVWIRRTWKALPQFPRRVLTTLAVIHLFLNFALYPMIAWAQLSSAQGALIRSYSILEKNPRPLLALGDPPIDALIPPGTRWADESCHWRRAPVIHAQTPPSGFWLIRASAPDGCTRVDLPGPQLPQLTQGFWSRVLRIHPGALWSCPDDALSTLCTLPLGPNQPNEPWTHSTL